jgi:hypothetical protein
MSQEPAGGGVDGADAQVLDEEQDACPGVGPADADVVEAVAMAEGDELSSDPTTTQMPSSPAHARMRSAARSSVSQSYPVNVSRCVPA